MDREAIHLYILDVIAYFLVSVITSELSQKLKKLYIGP